MLSFKAFAAVFDENFETSFEQFAEGEGISTREAQQDGKDVSRHIYLACYRTYSCIHCRAHLANHDELISKVRTVLKTVSLSFAITQIYQDESLLASINTS